MGQGLQRVLSYAAYDCAEGGREQVEPDHLLLGLFREDFVLIDAVASYYRLNSLKILERVLGNNPEAAVPAPLEQVVFGPAALQILCEAGLEAESFGHSRVQPEHLFLGFLEYKRAILPDLFLQRRVTVERVREIVSYLRFDSAPARRRETFSLPRGAQLTIEHHRLRRSLFGDRPFELVTLRLLRRF